MKEQFDFREYLQNAAKVSDPLLEITRANYQQYLDEEAFIADCKRTDKTTKTSFISSDYFLQNKDIDLSSAFDAKQNQILHIHGTKDPSVPLESVSTKFLNQIIVEQGDHDLEKPSYTKQWVQEWINFLLG